MKDSVPELSTVEKKFWKSHGLLWITHEYPDGRVVAPTPFCPTCHSRLDTKDSHGWFCVRCERKYPLPDGKDFNVVLREVHLKWEGARREDFEVISLDLPSEKLGAEDEGASYWVKVKVGQKSGKHIMIVYVGEKVGKGQTKDDYAQLFVDLDDEQIRFDKGNKNPMRILCKLEGEFLNSTTTIKKKVK